MPKTATSSSSPETVTSSASDANHLFKSSTASTSPSYWGFVYIAMAFLSLLTVVLGIWYQVTLAATNGTMQQDSLPIVDLGYTLQQATCLNQSNGYYTFSNIRYGESPTGELRFAAPRAASTNRTIQTGSDGDRKCFQANPGWLAVAGKFIRPYLMGQTDAFYAQYPSQASFPPQPIPPADPSETEDCLFLDVKVPAAAIRTKKAIDYNAPVLVWLYGGGYTAGYKTQYPADSLLAESRTEKGHEIVFVQLNYRVGAFGFLAGQEAKSNAGLLDQKLALEWVQQHIKQFGGDPEQVTVIGQSAGASSIEFHLTAQETATSEGPLFQKAILQSPFFFPAPGETQNEATYHGFLRLAGASSLSAAKKLPAEALRKANARLVLDAPYGQFRFGPVIDHTYVIAPPVTRLLEGRFRRPLPQVLGTNIAEGIGFTNPWVLNNNDFRAHVQTLFPAASSATISYIADILYPPPSDAAALPYRTNIDRAALLTSEVVLTCNAYLLALAYDNKTYNYLFDVPPGLHGDDLHYTWGPDPSTKSEEVRLALQDYVTSFTATGNPNYFGDTSFERYGKGNQVLDLMPGAIRSRPDPGASERCLLLQKNVWSHVQGGVSTM